jgi:poly-gamma-glutamate synthesis protein (capsule biosynthesis protein)
MPAHEVDEKRSMRTSIPLILLGLQFTFLQVVKAPGEKPASVTISAVGDMMIGSWSGDLLREHGPTYPFVRVAPYLQGSDVATGNLEGPHCTTGTADTKTYTYRMAPQLLDGYAWAGFDVLSLANNHAMDFGPQCMLENIAEIRKRGMEVCGGGADIDEAHEPTVIVRNGLSIAFLCYSTTFPESAWATPEQPGTAFPERNRLIRSVRSAAAEHDVVVVQFHWGEQGRTSPKDYQVGLAHLVVDNGADLVLGHHAHVLLGVEAYKGKLIFYGLGNFTFASFAETAKTSVIALVTLDDQGNLVRGEVMPINVDNHQVELQPIPLPGDPEVLSELRDASAMIGRGTTPPEIDDEGTIHLPH